MIIRKKVQVYNRGIHENLLALGYEYEGRVSHLGPWYDEYTHPDNDDWMAIYQDGSLVFLDICEFTEGSDKGIAIREQWEQKQAGTHVAH
jgi:hypothetical protein